jgi:hypothetical protein
MKTNINTTVFTILLSFIFCSCNTANNEPSTSSKLIFKTIKDSILFTGTAIKSYNNTTKEVIFSDSTTIKKIIAARKIKCYLDKDSLFTFTYAVDYMSSFVNDLVLYDNLIAHNYSFEDGYPNWIDNPDIISLRNQNKEKRAVAWAKFIAQLELEGRYKE